MLLLRSPAGMVKSALLSGIPQSAFLLEFIDASENEIIDLMNLFMI